MSNIRGTMVRAKLKQTGAAAAASKKSRESAHDKLVREKFEEIQNQLALLARDNEKIYGMVTDILQKLSNQQLQREQEQTEQPIHFPTKFDKINEATYTSDKHRQNV